MTEVLLSTQDLVVLGPPETLEVLVDIGPQGTRGSQIFVGLGNPNLISIGQTPNLNDLFINASPGPNYGYVYQYRSEIGGNTWVEFLRMNPVIFSRNETTTFEDGTAQIVIPVSSIIVSSGTPLTAENFSIQYSIAHTNPVSTAMSIPALSGTAPNQNLIINLSGVEWNGSSWVDLDTEVTTHLFISIV